MDKSIVPVNQIAARSSTGYEFLNSNGAEVVELEDDPVEVVEKQMENLKLNYQFDEKNVPKTFQNLMTVKMNSLKEFHFHIHELDCIMSFDEIGLILAKGGNGFSVMTDGTIETDDLEKSFIDYFWLMLKDPNVKLNFLGILVCTDKCYEMNITFDKNRSEKLDSEKLNTLLLPMLDSIDSIDHQFHINTIRCDGFDENSFLSILKHVKPGTLECIDFSVLWKEEEKYEMMKEIIATDQWKQAKKIASGEVIPPLKIDDLLHCEFCVLTLEKIEPETVIRTKEKFINSTNCNTCILASQNQDLDINAYRKFLFPDSLSENNTNTQFTGCIVYTYALPNSSNHLSVTLNKSNIRFEKNSN